MSAKRTERLLLRAWTPALAAWGRPGAARPRRKTSDMLHTPSALSPYPCAAYRTYFGRGQPMSRRAGGRRLFGRMPSKDRRREGPVNNIRRRSRHSFRQRWGRRGGGRGKRRSGAGRAPQHSTATGRHTPHARTKERASTTGDKDNGRSGRQQGVRPAEREQEKPTGWQDPATKASWQLSTTARHQTNADGAAQRPQPRAKETKTTRASTPLDSVLEVMRYPTVCGRCHRRATVRRSRVARREWAIGSVARRRAEPVRRDMPGLRQ